jgi:hypothetical protein
LTKIILEKTQKKTKKKEEDNFGRKHAGKAEVKFSTSSILIK